MDISSILSAIKNVGPAVAYGSTIVLAFWLKHELNQKKKWEKRYFNLREDRDEEIKQRKVEQNNTIDVFRNILSDDNQN